MSNIKPIDSDDQINIVWLGLHTVGFMLKFINDIPVQKTRRIMIEFPEEITTTEINPPQNFFDVQKQRLQFNSTFVKAA